LEKFVDDMDEMDNMDEGQNPKPVVSGATATVELL
jgi:hypothetical protein